VYIYIHTYKDQCLYVYRQLVGIGGGVTTLSLSLNTLSTPSSLGKLCIYIQVYVYICVYIYTCLYMYVYNTYMLVYVCIHMYVYIYMDIHTFLNKLSFLLNTLSTPSNKDLYLFIHIKIHVYIYT
jgi:hypothetical protein